MAEIEIAAFETEGGKPLPAVVQSRSLTPMEMLSRAVETGANIDMIDKLMGLQERWEANQGRKAFDAAVADAKSEIKPVIKNRQGNNSKYADLAAYAEEVDPILAKHGLSYRYSSRQDDKIHITCILSHRDGHFSETTLSSAADGSGSKNAIQAIGSAVEYLKRYTLTLALGLSSKSNDDDGRAAGGDEPISQEQLTLIRAKVEESGAHIGNYCKTLKIESLPELRKSQFQHAMNLLETKIKAKKKDAAQ